MPWLLDGNNLAGGRDRAKVRAAALQLARRERIRIVVYFDGAPPGGVPDVESLGRVEVRYVANADAAIVTFLGRGGKGWRLCTDDAALARKARQLGAEVVKAASFWSKVGRINGDAYDQARIDVAEEITYFQEAGDGDIDRPRLVPRRRRRRKR